MGTQPQAVVKAAQPCLPSCSSLVPLPQHRRTTSGLAEEHLGALLLPQQTSPSLSGLSPLDLPLRKTVMLRERMCWLETRLSLSHPPPRSLCLRAQAPTSASSSPPPAARGCRRSRPRWRRTCPPGSEPLLEAVMMSPAPPQPQG